MKKSTGAGSAVAAAGGLPSILRSEAAVPAAPTLTQEAYERLEEMIITLELAPGEAVSEAILSKRIGIGIGTTPIREALHRLARQYP